MIRVTARTAFSVDGSATLAGLFQPSASGRFGVAGSVVARKDWNLSGVAKIGVYGAIQNAVVPAKVRAVAQQAVTDALVDLYRLDLTRYNSGIVRFVAGRGLHGQAVSFGGEMYAPYDVGVTGFGRSAQGQFARPKMRVANINTAFTALIIGGRDLIGCELTRIRTFARFLDDGDQPDPHQHFPLEVYRVERKTAHNNLFVEWELASAIDVEGVMLPRRVIVRQYCDYVYRRWDAEKSTWAFARFLNCPYCGAGMFTETGEPTDNPAQDRCSKTMTACRRRYGDAPLPFRGFPAADSVR